MMKSITIEKTNIYAFTRFFNGGYSHTWNVQATPSEIEKLKAIIKAEEGRMAEVKYYIDDTLDVTHKFDKDGKLWCKTPIILEY